MANVSVHASLDALRAARPQARRLAFSPRSAQRYDHCTFRDGDILLFGPVTRGLPQELLDALPTGQRLKLPMRPNNRRRTEARRLWKESVCTCTSWCWQDH